MTTLARVALRLSIATCVLAGCGRDAPTTTQPETSILGPQARGCTLTASATQPYVVEWAPADKGLLETRLNKGPVAVTYDGCDMEVHARCHVDRAQYRYRPFAARKDDTLEIASVDDLYAKLPLGAVALERELRRSEGLRVGMAMVGRYESTVDFVSEADLLGDCDGVTHIIWAVTVGAHEVSARRETQGDTSVRIGKAAAGGSTKQARASISRDGSRDACAAAASTDSRPPADCGAVLRLEVVELGEAPPHMCRSGQSWDGRRCSYNRPRRPKPRDAGGPSDAHGRVKASDVVTALVPHRAALHACAVTHGAPPTTKIDVQLAIDGATGRVTTADATASYRNTALGKCVLVEARKLEFEPGRHPDATIVVRVPLR